MSIPQTCDTSQPAYLKRLLRLAGARAEQAVCVCGRHASELSLALCHDRYAQVECLRGVARRGADGPAEVLIIPGATAAESLLALVSKSARLLAPNAVIALKLEEIDDDCAVQAALAGLGLEVTSTVFDLSAEVLVAHRVRRPAMRLAA